MPSPLGHAMAGLATAWFGDAIAPSKPVHRMSIGAWRTSWRLWAVPAACVALAVSPDLDILVHTHRTVTHSLGAALIAAGIAAVAAWRLRLPIIRTAIFCGAAWASHVLLDWLGRDTSEPGGLMALWPFSHAWYKSGLDIFWEISRRYWKPNEFIVGNLISGSREILYLGPVLLLAWLAHRWRQLHEARDGRRLDAAGREEWSQY